ncbi:PhoH family protein [Flavobacteriaceae bacterium]|nr:PhoH family protein [Flavobacteriaceae bacterium]MBT5493827.1 PhoH family protein [Flavobacteriaceae bacterium]MBT6654308.1 PhoH family protein [Flavobacteriaceae bacterium]MDA9176858.1 PhoH family protein [Flavobacteriaceae bacterium]MDB2384036.1 PhoH family protein [Flavobacteriaceae bacterium]
MKKLEYFIKDIHPVEFFDKKNFDVVKIIKNNFPSIKIIIKGDRIVASGDEALITQLRIRLDSLIMIMKDNDSINDKTITSIMSGQGEKLISSLRGKLILHGVGKKKIKAHTINQIKIVDAFINNDMVFAIGPAGTGKTYTGIAVAVKALKDKIVKKIILTRPAVEAGESLGFLPGDMKDKLDPYMQPLYDALKEMIDTDKLDDYLKRGVIEIAPLAYMRGRTLDNAFVILDEGQNTTHNQMKMFLTRMGVNAKFMINGDPGQIDLPRRVMSGLKEANLVLKNIEGIKMIYLDDSDVIRHQVVKRIIEAYKNTEHSN